MDDLSEKLFGKIQWYADYRKSVGLFFCTNKRPIEEKAALEFFETSGRNLLAAEKAAHVSHHIALSIIGSDLLEEKGYFRAKIAQEDLIKSSHVPYTIVRATQFFEFLSSIAESSTIEKTVHLPPVFFNP